MVVEETLVHTEEVLASHSPETVAVDMHHIVAMAGAVGVAVYVHNTPHHEQGIVNIAVTL